MTKASFPLTATNEGLLLGVNYVGSIQRVLIIRTKDCTDLEWIIALATKL